MVKLLYQLTVFGGDKQKQVVDNLCVVTAGKGAGGQYTPGFQQDNCAVLHRHGIVETDIAFIRGKHISKYISSFDDVYNGAVAPIVIILYVYTSFKQYCNVSCLFTLTEDVLPLFKVLYPCLQTVQHAFHLGTGDIAEKIGIF